MTFLSTVESEAQVAARRQATRVNIAARRAGDLWVTQFYILCRQRILAFGLCLIFNPYPCFLQPVTRGSVRMISP